MPITLQIYFEGLCAFVPQANDTVLVILMDARNQDGQSKSLCNPNKRLRPHFPELLYFDPDENRPVSWFPYQCDLNLSFTSPPTEPPLISPSFSSNVIDMKDIDITYGVIEPSVLSGLCPYVVTRLTLAGGRFEAKNLLKDGVNSIRWTVGNRQPSPLSRDVLYTLDRAQDDYLTVQAKDSKTSAVKEERILRPPKGETTFSLLVRNDCACEPQTNPTDDSFLWFYYLCKNKPTDSNACHIPAREKVAVQAPLGDGKEETNGDGEAAIGAPGASDTFCPSVRFSS